MTVESNLARISYTISGAGPYTIPYYFLDDGDLIVIETDTGGNPTTLTITTDYTLTGAGDEDGGSLTLVSPTNGNTLIIINEPAITQLTQYPETGKFPAASHERALDKLTMIAKRIYDLASRSLRLNDGDTAAIPELPPSSPGKLIGWDVGGNLTNTSPAGVGPASIGTIELADGAVTNAKLADGAVTNAKLADATLTALAGLNADAGLVEQTGADTFTKTPITAFAKTLLDDADAATARATLGANDAANITTGDLAAARITTALNAAGTAPIYACRAWVNFNGADTVAIRASGNVSSITDNGTGDYTVNFTTAMPDANYVLVPLTGSDRSVGWNNVAAVAPTTSAFRIRNCYQSGAGGSTAIDSDYIHVAVFR